MVIPCGTVNHTHLDQSFEEREPLRVLSHASILDNFHKRLVEKTQTRWRLTGNQLLSLCKQSKAYIEDIRADWSYILQVNCEVGGGKLYF